MALFLGLHFFGYWMRGYSLKACKLHKFLIILLLPLLYGGFQLLPIDWLTHVLSPSSWKCWHHFADVAGCDITARITLSPEHTMFFCRVFFICLALGYLLFNLCRKRKELRFIAFGVVLSAGLNAVLAFVHLVKKSAIKGAAHSIVSDVARGTFINRNHFAFLMGLGVLMAVGLLFSINEDAEKSRKMNVSSISMWESLRGPILLIFFVIFSAMVCSLSRGAFLAVVPMALLLTGLWVMHQRHAGHSSVKINTFATIAIVIGALIVALPAVLSLLSERYRTLLSEDGIAADARFVIWGQSLRMVWDFLLTGSGFGSYEAVFQHYGAASLYDGLVNNAHNDWIEALTDMGVPVAVFLMAFVCYLLYRAWKHARNSREMRTKWLETGAMLALVAGMIHEFFDYSLRAPGNAVAFTACLTLAMLGCILPHDISDPRHHPEEVKKRQLPQTDHWSRHGFVLMGLFFLAVVLPVAVIGGKSAYWQLKAQQYMNLDRGAWRLKEADYQRIISMADVSLRYSPNAGAWKVRALGALRYSGILLDGLLPNDTQKIEKVKNLWNDVLESQLEACKLTPMDGYNQFQNAEYNEKVQQAFGRVDEAKLLQMYEYAYYCSRAQKEAVKPLVSFYIRSCIRLMSKRPLVKQDVLAASELRLKAINVLLEMLNEEKADYKFVFSQLRRLKPDNAVLKSIKIEEYSGQKALLDYYVELGFYGEAENLLDEMRESILARKYTGNSKRTADEQRLDDELFVADRKVRITAFQRKWEANGLARREHRALKEQRLKLSLELLEKRGKDGRGFSMSGDAHRLMAGLPNAFDAALLAAKEDCLHGHYDEALHDLLVFVYAQDNPPMELLERAWNQLQVMDGATAASMARIHRFVKIAIAYRLADSQDAAFPEAEASDWLATLLEMERWNSENYRDNWVQSHLIPYYAGQILAHLGRYDEAAEAYRRALKLSPRNLYVACRLAELPGDAAQKVDWLDAVLAERPLGSAFNSGVILWGFADGGSPVFTSPDETFSQVFSLLCTGDIQQDYDLEVSFTRPNGKALFSKTPDMSSTRHTVSWRVGEIHEFKVKCRPVMDSLQRGRRRPYPGQIFAVVKLVYNSGKGREGISLSPSGVFPVFGLK